MKLMRMHDSPRAGPNFFMTDHNQEKLCPGRQGSAIQLEASHFRGEAEDSLVWTVHCVTIFSHGIVIIIDPKNNTEFKVNGQKLKTFLITKPAA